MKREMADLLGDILVPLVGALIVQFLTWSQMRSIRRGQPLTPFMKGLLGYGFFALLGMGYLIAAGSRSYLRWPDGALYSLIFLWFALLGFIAYWQHHHRAAKLSAGDGGGRIRWRAFVQGLPLVGLLVSLVGAAVELDLVLQGHGTLVPGILWPAGILIAIVLARRNRRATVVTAFRAFTALLLIGALARRPSAAGLTVAAIAGLALYVLSRYVPASPRSAADLRERHTGSTA
jgi:hypothetical protein